MVVLEPSQALHTVRRLTLALVAVAFASLVGVASGLVGSLALFALGWEIWQAVREATVFEWDAEYLRLFGFGRSREEIPLSTIHQVEVGSPSGAFLVRVFRKDGGEPLEVDSHAVVWPGRGRFVAMVRHLNAAVPALGSGEVGGMVLGKVYSYAYPERVRQAIHRSVPSSLGLFAFWGALGACVFTSHAFLVDASIAIVLAVVAGWVEWRARLPYRLAAKAAYDRVTRSVNGLEVTRGERSWTVSGPYPESTFGLVVEGRRWRLYRDARGRPYYFDPDAMIEDESDSSSISDLTQPR